MMSLSWHGFFSAPPFTNAADQTSPNSKPVAAAGEQSPEQAVGGHENLKRLRTACQSDAKRFCKDVKAGGGRIVKCLREHESELAAGCREALPAASVKP